MTALHDLTILDAGALIAARRLSSMDLTRHLLDRIAALDPELRAYATPTPERALDDARRADDEIARGRYRGPLHGVPVAVKDLVAVAGVPTAAGMPLHRNRIATADAEVVRRLADAGAVLLGTLQMTEGAYFEHHPDVAAPRNPLDPDRWPGASSSGPGVAVAAGLAFAALGSDTGGSIRFPAAANRVTGLKPTYGLVSTHGTVPAAGSLDHIGPLARTAADIGVVLDALTGTATVHHGPDGLDGVTVGVVPADGVDDRAAAAVRATVDALRGLGADVRAVALPDTAAVRDAWAVICTAEAARNHRDTYPSRAAEYGPIAGFLDAGRAVSDDELAGARQVRTGWSAALAGVFERVDLLLAPVQPETDVSVARAAELVADPAALAAFVRFATPFDMSGSPVLTLPAGPASVQLVARHRAEPLLLRAGRALQQEPAGQAGPAASASANAGADGTRSTTTGFGARLISSRNTSGRE